MGNQRNLRTRISKEEEEDVTTTKTQTLQDYERIREQRIKENDEKLRKLGLLKLALQPKKTLRPYIKKNPIPSDQPERRSSRLMTLPPVDYGLKRPYAQHEKEEHSSSSKKKKEEGIYIPEGTNPEVYTKEHEKLLGDCETAWELYVDGYDEDGDRIYDPTKGDKCHQCRFITIGQLTSCNKCELPQGQLCGDCLYTRYGENVREADFNPKWTCPCCREICNCNSCRRKNGWVPTGNIYNKVVKLGFKSVAHYLIKTRRSEGSMEGSAAENIVAQEIPETTQDTTQKGPIRTRRALRS
ncbi:Zinc-finger domain of monoamine-oxidase A repressor R1 [Trifolium repens]|nr:Zinc-finger domain of monoamine-oxidase A repressor R1 [Trifolium repens]